MQVFSGYQVFRQCAMQLSARKVIIPNGMRRKNESDNRNRKIDY